MAAVIGVMAAQLRTRLAMAAQTIVAVLRSRASLLRTAVTTMRLTSELMTREAMERGGVASRMSQGRKRVGKNGTQRALETAALGMRKTTLLHPLSY